jgi:hypothetical protein
LQVYRFYEKVIENFSKKKGKEVIDACESVVHRDSTKIEFHSITMAKIIDEHT